jgi:hypothetical protein
VTPINDDTAILPTDLDHDGEPAETRDDSLAEELAKAAPKRWWNQSTVVLGAVALLIGGFVGGLEAQKHWGTAATAAGRGTGTYNGAAGGQNRGGYGGFPGAGTAGGQRGTQGGTPGGAATTAAAGTTGTVKLVDGATIYVQTSTGDVVTVKTDGKTTVSTAAKGKVSDVKAGQSVTVQGAADADGTVTATSVTTQK